MTVKELKQYLSGLHDELEVFVDLEPEPTFALVEYVPEIDDDVPHVLIKGTK